MSPRYTEYHPRWYRRRMPIFWWLGKAAYARFIGRELTSLAVGYVAVLLIVFTVVLGQGEAAFARWTAFLQRPLVLAFHGFVLAMLLFHAVTWLHLAPKALVVRIGRRRVAPRLVLLGHWAAWLLASAIVAWVLVGR